MTSKNEVDEVWKSAPVLCELKRGTTPRISRVPCDEATTLVTKAFDVPFDGVYALKEARHLLQGVGHEYRLEVVSVLKARAYPGGDGVHVLQYR